MSKESWERRHTDYHSAFCDAALHPTELKADKADASICHLGTAPAAQRRGQAFSDSLPKDVVSAKRLVQWKDSKHQTIKQDGTQW